MAIKNFYVYLFYIIIDAFNVLSFSQAVYTASESEGQVEVCANSLVPIARDALATIITAPQSANGMYKRISKSKIKLYILSHKAVGTNRITKSDYLAEH